LKPRGEVVALAHPVRRAWEALTAEGVPFKLEDQSAGWLAVADVDQLDQVLWALLDNALKYGELTPISVEIVPVPDQRRLRLTISDLGPGVLEADRTRLFRRFERGTERTADDGSGLGLYVSRELCRAMDGDLVLEPQLAGRGASLSIYLPGEPPEGE
ncbi:MAG: ATP-binding protein, partial [Chloroflexota bacterium]|nr:ATP-binding protein [Chloroflexota bacterium]